MKKTTKTKKTWMKISKKTNLTYLMIFKITPWSSDDEDSTILDLTIISLYSFSDGGFG